MNAARPAMAPTRGGGAASLANSIPCVAAERLTKSYLTREGNRLRVIESLDFEGKDGEFVSVIGPSGCGKSTLFRILAGLEPPDSGTVTIRGVPLDPNAHAVAYMPQRDHLFPWRTIERNVTLPLEIQGVPLREARRRVQSLFVTFGLKGFENAHPYALSGGMRQRAALMRTVVQERDLMLLDEPFGALDSLTRSEMQDFLLRVWTDVETTVVFITHDIREAIYLSDTVYVLSARPARVLRRLEITLPRPRSTATIVLPEFARLEAHALELLRSESAIADGGR